MESQKIEKNLTPDKDLNMISLTQVIIGLLVTLMMRSAQVVETSVSVITNEAFQGVLATGDIAQKCGDNLFSVSH